MMEKYKGHKYRPGVQEGSSLLANRKWEGGHLAAIATDVRRGA